MSELTIEQRVAAARIAGERGWHAEPMLFARRLRAYQRQTGKQELTPKQRRRMHHKSMTFAARIPEVSS